MLELNEKELDQVNGGLGEGNEQFVNVSGDHAGGILGDKDGYDFRAVGAPDTDGGLIN